MVNRDVLMSIKPQYAAAILSGSKTFELRRRRPSFAPGSRVVVYSSAPDQKLLGTFEAGEIHADDPERLWALVSEDAGIGREAFDAYFEGCELAYAIEVRSPRRLEPKSLRFRPPQSYLFLTRRRNSHQTILRWAAGSGPV
jgi:predicted transcriptional regulator